MERSNISLEISPLISLGRNDSNAFLLVEMTVINSVDLTVIC